MMIVGVMASGRKSFDSDYRDLAETAGGAIADRGCHLLTGGGVGLMEIVGRAFLSKKGELAKDGKPTGSLISILRAEKLPSLEKGKRKWQANEDNKIGEIVIRTHLPYSGDQGLDTLSRNHINALTSDLIVVLPGGSGTLSELQLAWEYDKHIMLYLGNNGNVGGQTPMQLKAKFSGGRVVVGLNGAQLSKWLKETKP